MSEVIRVLAVVAVIGYVIGRQLMGEPLRGKRVVVLPVILAVAGVATWASTAAMLNRPMLPAWWSAA